MPFYLADDVESVRKCSLLVFRFVPLILAPYQLVRRQSLYLYDVYHSSLPNVNVV